MMAQALADGLSLEGGGEALSIGAAGLFLRSLGGNPMDVHLHASVNLRRWLLRQDVLSLRNKIMLLLTWAVAGDPLDSNQKPAPQPDMAAVAALPARSQDALLDAISHHIYNQPPSRLVDGHQSRHDEGSQAHGQLLASANIRSRYDPEALIARLAEIVCHDHSPRCTPSSTISRSSKKNPAPPTTMALDPPRVRRPGRGDLVRQEHGGLRGSCSSCSTPPGRELRGPRAPLVVCVPAPVRSIA